MKSVAAAPRLLPLLNRAAMGDPLNDLAVSIDVPASALPQLLPDVGAHQIKKDRQVD